MQVWTESGSKVIVISYTSELQTYLTYLPNMQQMIQSLEIASPPGMQSNNPVANNSAQQQQQRQGSSGSNSQTMDDGSSSSSSSTIPWLPQGLLKYCFAIFLTICLWILIALAIEFNVPVICCAWYFATERLALCF